MDSDSSPSSTEPSRFVAARLDLREMFGTEPVPLDYVLPGLLAGTVGVLASPGATGKSMWALEAACAVAGGRAADLLDLRLTTTGRAVYVCLEDPSIILHHRLHAIAGRLDECAREALCSRLHIHVMRGGALDMGDRGHLDGLARECEGVRLVAIDTLSRAHTADENSNSEMARLMSRVEALCARTGAAVLLLHHANKYSAREGTGAEQHAARGASAIVDHARWGATLSRMTEAEAETLCDPESSPDPLLPLRIRERRGFYVRLAIPKLNYGEPMEDQWYRRERGGVLVPVHLEYMPTAARAPTAAESRASKVAGWR